MIAAGYSMDLYCANEQTCLGKTWEGPAKASFYGESWSQCRKQAEKMGWKFIPNRDCLCKDCLVLNPTLPQN